MSSFLQQLNLRPQERRILVLVLTVVLVVLNAVFVWPHFRDWRTVRKDLAQGEQTLRDYQAEVDKISEYRARLAKLEGLGSAVLPAEQALQLVRTVQNLAGQHNVAVTSTRLVPGSSVSTNVFFDEQTVVIGVNTPEKELVDFLHALGSGDSMIRVRDMDLRPDPSQMKLNGNITAVASYQKRPKMPPSSVKPKAPATTSAATKSTP